MLSIVIPLAPWLSHDQWLRVSTLFEGTLRSVLQQSDRNGIRVIIVGHEAPPLPQDDRIEFVTANFDPPTVVSEPDGIRDKFKKLSLGLERVGRAQTDFVMRLDADDLVHRDLAAYVNANLDSKGWNIRLAYNYVPGRRHVHLFDDWVEHAILNADVLNLPQVGHRPPDPGCLFSRWGHQELTAALACRDIRLDDLPFPAMCYVRQSGSLSSHRSTNRSRAIPSVRMTVGRGLRVRPLTSRLRERYAIANR